MEIIGNKIQMLVSEEEANVLLMALGRYTGPYHPDAKLNEEEQARSDRMIKAALDMCNCIGDELTRIYHEAEEIKFYQGR